MNSLEPVGRSESQRPKSVCASLTLSTHNHSHFNTDTDNRIHVCDRPSQYEELQAAYAGVDNVKVLKDGHAVSRSSDFIMYSVEAEFIVDVVKEYGPCELSLSYVPFLFLQ